MRDDIILASTARRLRSSGLRWRPQVGDWCALLDGASESAGGLWLVTRADAEVGWAEVNDIAAQWPPARIASADALWLPTAGQLKAWLRAHNYQVTTIEGAMTVTPADTPPSGPLPQPKPMRPGWAAAILNHNTAPVTAPQAPDSPTRHRCVARHPHTVAAIEAEGLAESEAVAEVVIQLLRAGER